MKNLIIVAVGIAATLTASPSPARKLWETQYEKVDPKIQQWFKDQKIPGTRTPCCDIADGVTAEEDIRGLDYFTRWVIANGKSEIVIPWMKVPPEAIITGPNLYGNPVVWWYTDNVVIRIKCYAPGAKG